MRFCKMAAVAPQTIFCEIARLSPAASVVKPPPRKAAGTLGASGRECGGQLALDLAVLRFDKVIPKPTSRREYKWKMIMIWMVAEKNIILTQRFAISCIYILRAEYNWVLLKFCNYSALSIIGISASACMTFWVFLIVVSITERMTAKAFAPSSERNNPDTFCLTLNVRTALSEALLSGGTPEWYRKVNK